MSRWDTYVERYRRGEWRDRIFHGLILDDAKKRGTAPTLLDIGCGHGFGDDLRLQQSLARAAGKYIGVEPDPLVAPGEHITEWHCCWFEDAPLPARSVDIAFANMVLEHLVEPRRFWDKLHDVLREGGVFWGLTMDGRHWFRQASLLTERLRIKDAYLNLLRGRRGMERYENYPVHYRCNTPQQIAPLAKRFRACDFLEFAREGQLNYYVPRTLRPFTNWLDRRALKKGKPGSVLAIRVMK